MSPMSLEKFENLALDKGIRKGQFGKKCDWTKVRAEILRLKKDPKTSAFNTDEVREMTKKYTVTGEPMSRLRVRNWLLKMCEKNQATRKLEGETHYYYVNE